MGIISTIIVGLIVGAIARLVMPGDQKMGWILTCLLGIAAGEPAGWIASVVGAVALLFVTGLLRRQ
jgi:uncharacterized membrane protein YeaQ/YmgE (transglycosylase-associated protein family)